MKKGWRWIAQFRRYRVGTPMAFGLVALPLMPMVSAVVGAVSITFFDWVTSFTKPAGHRMWDVFHRKIDPVTTKKFTPPRETVSCLCPDDYWE